MALSHRSAGHKYEGNVAGENARVHFGDVYNLPPDRHEAPSGPISTVPFPRDPDHVHRGPLVDDICEKLSVPAARVALVGLGGVGKSQLAIERAHQVRAESPDTWVLWLHTSNAARFELSVRDTLEQLKVPGGNDPTANAFQLFRAWLRDAPERKWLLILDNADDVRFLLEYPAKEERAQDEGHGARSRERYLDYLPVHAQGKVLVTTRTRAAALEVVDAKSIVPIGPMGEEDAVSLVDRKLEGRCTREGAVSLASALDFIPLAVTQATAYIRESDSRFTIEDYVKRVASTNVSKLGILDRDEKDLRRDRDASNSITLTWQISFKHVRDIRPSAADLLSLMSCFDRQAIPETLLKGRRGGIVDKEGPNHDAGEEHGEGDDKEPGSNNDSDGDSYSARDSVDDHFEPGADQFEDDVRMLRNYSFISVTKETANFEMHRLVQLATEKWLRQNSCLDHWQSKFVTSLDADFPVGTHENWARCRHLCPHAMKAIDMKLPPGDAILRQAHLLFSSAWYACEQGNFAQAQAMGARSVKLRKKALGLKHPDTLASMSNLAWTYQSQGLHSKAADLGARTLELTEEVLGPKHPETLASMSNLAWTYQSQGLHSEAVDLGARTLELMEEVLGPKHPHTLTSMGNLAWTYQSQGLYSEAADLGARTLELKEEVLGPKHPETLAGMSNLAWTYQSQGLHSEAAALRAKTFKL